MGDTKNFRRVWKKPKRPFNFELKMDELKTVGTFGLKTKRELWRSRTELSRLRHQARSLLAVRQEVREKEEPILMHSLSRIGLVEKTATLDDVLNLEIENLLARRFQTIVFKKSQNLQVKLLANPRLRSHSHNVMADTKVRARIWFWQPTVERIYSPHRTIIGAEH